jgi:hypothetical protein
MTEEKLDDLLLELSNKNTIVKIEPFYFTVYANGEFKLFDKDVALFHQVYSKIRIFAQDNNIDLTKMSNEYIFGTIEKINESNELQTICYDVINQHIKQFGDDFYYPINPDESFIKTMLEKDGQITIKFNIQSHSKKAISIANSSNDQTIIYYLEDNQLKQIILSKKYSIMIHEST